VTPERDDLPPTGAAALEVFLRRRGCPDYVVDEGLDGLIERWERVTDAVETGYPLGLDDYLNDVDARQLIHDATPVAGRSIARRVAPKLEIADQRMRALLRPAQHCLWGDALAKRNGWSRETHWWYFEVPRHAGPTLMGDLGFL